MTAQMVMFLMLGAASGGFINGLTGTGTALFALGFYLVVLDPTTAVAIVAIMSILVGLQGLWIVRRAIFANPKRLLRFVAPGLMGVPLGLSLLHLIDAATLRIFLGTFLIIYGTYFGLRTALPAITGHTPLVDISAGFLGGVLGGSAAVSGAVPAMWLSFRPWTKSQTRAVLQPFNVAILTTTTGLLWAQGAIGQTALNALIITVPVGLIAAQLGIWVFGKITDLTFRRLLIFLNLLMGIGILISELF